MSQSNCLLFFLLYQIVLVAQFLSIPGGISDHTAYSCREFEKVQVQCSDSKIDINLIYIL